MTTSLPYDVIVGTCSAVIVRSAMPRTSGFSCIESLTKDPACITALSGCDLAFWMRYRYTSFFTCTCGDVTSCATSWKCDDVSLPTVICAMTCLTAAICTAGSGERRQSLMLPMPSPPRKKLLPPAGM